MKKIDKIQKTIKRKVNENRLRRSVQSILNNTLPTILSEINQLDQAFLDAKPVKELDVRKTHGDKRIENPATGNDIKLRTALKAKKGSAVYAKGKSMYNALKDEPTNERAYASTDGKPYFDYDPGKDKLTEAGIPNKFKVVRKFRLQGFVFNTGDYVKKAEKFGSNIVLNTNNNEKLSIDFGDFDAAKRRGDIKEGKLTEAARAHDWVEQYGEIGQIHKVRGRAAYVKFPSTSDIAFDVIELASLKKTGKKHKGKDLYLSEGKLNEGNNLYDHVRQLKNSFSIFKQHSRDGYKELDKAFNIRSIETLLGKMLKWMDTAPAMREGKLTEASKSQVTKAFSDISKLSVAMLLNIEKFKAAKAKGDEKAIAKHRKLAYDLQNKKKKMEADLDKMITGIDKDVELAITEGFVVTRNAWNRMSDDEKIDALQTAYEDPDEAMKHYEKKWEDLPSVATQNMYKESKLTESIGHWTGLLDDLIAFGFGNLVVKFKGAALGKVKDFEKLSNGSRITQLTFNYLLDKGGLKHNHARNRAELGSKASKYKKGTVELTEGKLTEVRGLNDLKDGYYSISDELADMKAYIEGVRNHPEGMDWETNKLGKGGLQKELQLFKQIERLFNKSKLGKVL